MALYPAPSIYNNVFNSVFFQGNNNGRYLEKDGDVMVGSLNVGGDLSMGSNAISIYGTRGCYNQTGLTSLTDSNKIGWHVSINQTLGTAVGSGFRNGTALILLTTAIPIFLGATYFITCVTAGTLNFTTYGWSSGSTTSVNLKAHKRTLNLAMTPGQSVRLEPCQFMNFSSSTVRPLININVTGGTYTITSLIVYSKMV